MYRGGESVEATLYIKDGCAEVVLSDKGTGKRVGVHWFKTLDEALDWLAAMKWDYKIAA